MKIRTDFVSNSSSSSFIVAINKNYTVDEFSKDVAKATSNPKDDYHNPNIVKRNQNILEFCLNTYELSFVGTWILRTEERIYDRAEYDKMFCEGSFDSLLKDIKRAKEDNAEFWLKKQYGNAFVDDSGDAHVFIDVDSRGLAVDKSQMGWYFNRHGWADDEYENRPEQLESRLKNLKEIAEADYQDKILMTKSDIYQITINSIKNTRNLLEAGEKFEFESWENLDSLEKRIKNGEKIIAIRNNYQGDGYDPYALYSEDGSEGMDGFPDIAMEFLGCLD